MAKLIAVPDRLPNPRASSRSVFGAEPLTQALALAQAGESKCAVAFTFEELEQGLVHASPEYWRVQMRTNADRVRASLKIPYGRWVVRSQLDRANRRLVLWFVPFSRRRR